MAELTALDPPSTMTVEAFADTILPGAERYPGDRAVAGATDGPGAVEAGALDLLSLPATGFAPMLAGLAAMLDEHARQHAARAGISLDDAVPPFVSLTFDERTRLVRELTAAEHPEREVWVGLALFSYMAFDSAAHLPTAEALASGHPGLAMLGFEAPDPDGLWRYPRYSYGRQLAELHPATTSTGSVR